MLVGLFDILVISSVIFLNYKLWKWKPLKISEWLIFSLICLFFFTFILPFVSVEIEIAVFNWFYRDETTDGFEGLYIFLRWPTYWFLGFLEFLYLLLITFGFQNLKSASKGSSMNP
ncbi:MAG: hypothetical protein RIE52_14090 [Balneola sp.]|jgi:hypothetical protein